MNTVLEERMKDDICIEEMNFFSLFNHRYPCVILSGSKLNGGHFYLPFKGRFFMKATVKVTKTRVAMVKVLGSSPYYTREDR